MEIERPQASSVVPAEGIHWATDRRAHVKTADKHVKTADNEVAAPGVAVSVRVAWVGQEAQIAVAAVATGWGTGRFRAAALEEVRALLEVEVVVVSMEGRHVRVVRVALPVLGVEVDALVVEADAGSEEYP